MLCEKHYMRQRRRGTVRLKAEVSPPRPERTHSQGYVLEYMPEHPLWQDVQGRIYQHRRVFFDCHGKGPHCCHWCGKVVAWDEMDVDHVNAVRDDNDPGNLVASCPPCNKDRGRAKAAETARANAKHRIEFGGETLTPQQWATRIGISRTALMWRMANGWPIERALTDARGKTGPRPL